MRKLPIRSTARWKCETVLACSTRWAVRDPKLADQLKDALTSQTLFSLKIEEPEP